MSVIMENKRITCITMLNEKSIKSIEKKVKGVGFDLCKVQYKENNRKEIDKLPSHATVCVWKNGNKEEIKEFIKKIKMTNVKLKIIGTKIKKSYGDSFNIYFEFEENNEFRKIQDIVYEYRKIEKYNPKTFVPHITIHIDKDYSKILMLQDYIMKNFKPFDVEFDHLGVYEIYPPVKIL